ncbi:MAG: patatin-like phospholipase family protein [Promethearchaeota archaeon]|nr:MAG: patatin-like phospholipase family protein [Candidatus Lokiarchaeota archaeon]
MNPPNKFSHDEFSQNKLKTAFVFSGGSSLGAMEVGMLKALVEAGVKPDFVVGTSVGALNATYFAFHPNLEGVMELEKIWLAIRSHQIFPVSAKNSVRGLLQKQNYLVDPKGLISLLEEMLPTKELESAQIPVHVVATDVNTGEEIVFSEGNAIPILTASAAIPMIYPPVNIDHHELIDGGVVNNTPISTAVRLGAERIIVLPTGYTCDRRTTPKSLLEMALTTFSYMVYKKMATDFDLFKNQVILRVIPTLCPLSVSSHDFSQSEELIQRAYIQTQDWLKQGSLEHEELPRIMQFHSH